jgi:hypothetical protein
MKKDTFKIKGSLSQDSRSGFSVGKYRLPLSQHQLCPLQVEVSITPKALPSCPNLPSLGNHQP